jgi:hypothetical protein
MRKKSKGKRMIRASATFTAAIIVLAVFTVSTAPVSAAMASVTRDHPFIVETNEEFKVTLTQTGFFFYGDVEETLPDGFGYVTGSYRGNGTADYDLANRTLTVTFVDDETVTYNVTASSDPGTAEFVGEYHAVVANFSDPYETGTVFGFPVLVVASSTSGSVSGTITYASNGAGIEGATVKLTQGGTEIDSTTTDASGDYDFTDVAAGDYYVNASKSGFWENAAAVTVTGGATATADMMLMLKGDFNNNGAVDIGDVAKVANMVVGNVQKDLQADFNGNGDVDIGDAAKIANYFVGNIGAL